MIEETQENLGDEITHGVLSHDVGQVLSSQDIGDTTIKQEDTELDSNVPNEGQPVLIAQLVETLRSVINVYDSQNREEFKTLNSFLGTNITRTYNSLDTFKESTKDGVNVLNEIITLLNQCIDNQSKNIENLKKII